MSPPRPEGGPGPLDHLRVPLKLIEPLVMREARAVWEARESAIAGLLNRIASGTSRITVAWGWNDPRLVQDPRPPRPANWGRAEQERYEASLRKQTMAYFEDLARTEAGFRLLSDLDASPFRITVIPWPGVRNQTDFGTENNFRDAYVQKDGRPGPGTFAEIKINPALTTLARPGEKEEPWMTERVRYGLYHELVHAWHGVRGTVAREEEAAEQQAIGLGAFASEPVTENKIRQQLGKELRPRV